MKLYEIYENGCRFATIAARTASSALRKAARQNPRRVEDYNGWSGVETWRACEPGGPFVASAIVQVPGRGDGRVVVSS